MTLKEITRNKAVAVGAVSYYIDHYVTSRMARYTYGTCCSIPFIPWRPSHMARIEDVTPGFDGSPMLEGYFAKILQKVKWISLVDYSLVLNPQ